MKNITPNLFTYSEIENNIEVYDIDYKLDIYYNQWEITSDIFCDLKVYKKNIKDFTKEDFELLTANSWLILLMHNLDKLNLPHFKIPFEKFNEGELKLLIEQIRTDLGTIH